MGAQDPMVVQPTGGSIETRNWRGIRWKFRSTFIPAIVPPLKMDMSPANMDLPRPCIWYENRMTLRI